MVASNKAPVNTWPTVWGEWKLLFSGISAQECEFKLLLLTPPPPPMPFWASGAQTLEVEPFKCQVALWVASDAGHHGYSVCETDRGPPKVPPSR